MAKPALGRGLGALLGGAPVLAKPAPATPVTTAVPAAPTVAPVAPTLPDARDHVQRAALDRIRPCPLQPRKDFSSESLRELADSIREQGIVQPLIVREKDGHWELIAGERRWRAAQLAGLNEVPVIVRQADDRAVLEMSLIDNLQRENLNAIEEAQRYSQLVSQFQLTHEEAAAKVGKSRAVVANALRLLKLPQVVQNFLREGRLRAFGVTSPARLPGLPDVSTTAEAGFQTLAMSTWHGRVHLLPACHRLHFCLVSHSPAVLDGCVGI